MTERRIITVLSGKGGTGKTTVAAGLATVMDNSYYIDSDVEEPNGKFFLNPQIAKKERFTKPVPRIVEASCTYCGKCADECQYSAISIISNTKKTFVFDELCHSCGVCWTVCPENAIEQLPKPVGYINRGIASGKKYESFREGLLDVGEPSGVPLINHLLSKFDDNRNYIIDAPPGTSCPVVAALMPCDFALIVTEPTPFGVNDLELTLEMIGEIGKKSGIIINKQRGDSRIVEDIAEKYSVPVIGTIPYNRAIAEDYSNGIISPVLKNEIEKIAGGLKWTD
ncbi:MAG: ATP-binding protein [bacterium]